MVTLTEPLRGVAPGQTVVLYQGSRVLGQATIDAARSLQRAALYRAPDTAHGSGQWRRPAGCIRRPFLPPSPGSRPFGPAECCNFLRSVNFVSQLTRCNVSPGDLLVESRNQHGAARTSQSCHLGLRSTHRTESSQMAMNKKALQSAIALAGVSAFALTACTGPVRWRRQVTGRGRRPDHLRHHGQGHRPGSGRLLRRRLVHGDEPDLLLPAQLEAGQRRSRAGPGRVGLLHHAHRVHRQAQARPEVGQRPRAGLQGRQVLLRPADQDQRPRRSRKPAVQPRKQ